MHREAHGGCTRADWRGHPKLLGHHEEWSNIIQKEQSKGWELLAGVTSFIIPVYQQKHLLLCCITFITSISFIETLPVCYLPSQTLIQTARDFELPDVDQKLTRLKVEVSLPPSLIDWIDNHGQGMMRKRKETEREGEKKGKEVTCVPNANVDHQ